MPSSGQWDSMPLGLMIHDFEHDFPNTLNRALLFMFEQLELAA